MAEVKKQSVTRLDVRITYDVEFTPEDLRIVMAALTAAGTGQPIKPEFKNLALDLQDRLFRDRNQKVISQLQNIDKHKRNHVPDVDHIQERHR